MAGVSVWVLYAIGIALTLATAIQACGISTHTEIAHRAIKQFNNPKYLSIILRHQDAYQAGNPFPDFAYASYCHKGIYHDFSEDAHWGEFLNHTVHYVHEHYPQPWDDATEKLVAFAFGFVSHGVADVLWHSLEGLQDGFLQMMGNSDFHGSFDQAHSVGDPGGDVVVNYGETLPYATNQDWYIPSIDVANIFKRMHGDSSPITASIVAECAGVLYAGRVGEKLAMAKAYPTFAKKSPWMLDNFENYFLGGVNDMASWSALTYEKLSQVFESDPDSCTYTHNEMNMVCKNTTLSSSVVNNMIASDRSPRWNKRNPRPLYPLADIEELSKGMTVKHTERGVYISHKGGMGSKLHKDVITKVENMPIIGDSMESHELILQELQVENHKIQISSVKASSVLSTTTDYAHLGMALTSGDVNGDGIKDLVMSAPNWSGDNKPALGRVYIIYGIKGQVPTSRAVDDSANVVLEGTEPYAMFGQGLTTGDFDGDGTVDIAVGTPGSGRRDNTYMGRVSIFLNKNKEFKSFATPDIVIDGVDFQHNFGSLLKSRNLDGDKNDELIVGAASAPPRQRGRVAVFNGRTLQNGGKVMNATQADWTIEGVDDYSWFGQSLDVSADGKTLVVGAPLTRLCDTDVCSAFDPKDVQAAGRVYGFDTVSRKKIFTLTGSSNMEACGQSVAIGSPYGDHQEYVAVGCPLMLTHHKTLFIPYSMNQTGSVLVAPLSALVQAGKSSSSSVPGLAMRVDGDRYFSRLGKNIAFADTNGDHIDDLVIAAPRRSDEITGLIYGMLKGAVYSFTGGARFPKGGVTLRPVDASLSYESPGTQSIFGSALGVWDCDGDGVDDLVVQARHGSTSSRLGGTVTVHNNTRH